MKKRSWKRKQKFARVVKGYGYVFSSREFSPSYNVAPPPGGIGQKPKALRSNVCHQCPPGGPLLPLSRPPRCNSLFRDASAVASSERSDLASGGWSVGRWVGRAAAYFPHEASVARQPSLGRKRSVLQVRGTYRSPVEPHGHKGKPPHHGNSHRGCWQPPTRCMA